jgi:hypothetical protein
MIIAASKQATLKINKYSNAVIYIYLTIPNDHQISELK